MSSLTILKIGRRVALWIGLALILSAAPSCSHKTVRPASPPLSPIATPAVVASPPPKAKPKAFRPFAFPDLDTGQISSLQFSPDGRRLAFGYGRDAEVSMWNLETGRLAWQRYVAGGSGGPLIFDPHGRFLVVQCHDPDSEEPTWICSVKGDLIRKLPGYTMGSGPDVRLERMGHFLVTSGAHDVLKHDKNDPNSYSYTQPIPLTEVWNTHTWRRVDRVFASPPLPVPLTRYGRIISRIAHPSWQIPLYENSVCKGDFCVSIGIDNSDELAVFQIHTQKKLWQAVIKHNYPRVAAISPNGRTLAIGTMGGTVELRDLRTGRLLHRTHCVNDVIRCLTYSPNGRVLAAAGDWNNDTTDGVRLLDNRSGKLLAVLKAEFPNHNSEEKDWTLDHPRWFAALPDLSYLASDTVVAKIRTPGHIRDAGMIDRFRRPGRIRAALRACYQRIR